MKSWFVARPYEYASFQQEVRDAFPTLYVIVQNGTVFIRGSLILEGSAGKIIDQYQIEIEIPADYPRNTPTVRETGGRLSKIADRHFDPVKQTACLFFRDEKYRYYPKGTSISKFIQNLVKKFFYWQTDYDLNGGNPSFGGRGHGVNAVVEFYSELLDTKDLQVISKFLKYLGAKKVKRDWRCYCGSGKKISTCHLAKLNDLRAKIMLKDARKSLEELTLAIHKAREIKN